MSAYTPPPHQAFQTWKSDTWNHWLQAQPDDVRTAFSGLLSTPPTEAQFQDIVAQTQSYQKYQAITQTDQSDIGRGGSGVFTFSLLGALGCTPDSNSVTVGGVKYDNVDKQQTVFHKNSSDVKFLNFLSPQMIEAYGKPYAGVKTVGFNDDGTIKIIFI